MAAHGIEHDEMGEQLHLNELRLLGMEVDSAQSVFELTEAGLDVPSHVVHLFHTLDGKLEPVQVRDQDFPLLLARGRVVDTELHDTNLDLAEPLEVPAAVVGVLGERRFVVAVRMLDMV